jgi:hypothetical protein
MLDRSAIDRLTQTLDTNGPEDNLALAEDGDAAALVALAGHPRVHADVLAVIGQRILAEGGDVGADYASNGDPIPSAVEDLDRLLIVHPAAPGPLRDAVLSRHQGDAFFVLSAACHPRATLAALERAADWPAASPLHDRPWLTLLDPARVPPLALEAWAQGSLGLRREAAARIGRSEAQLAALARDRSRQVRRAVASNPFAGAERARLAVEDPAPEVRARAAAALSALPEEACPADARAANGDRAASGNPRAEIAEPAAFAATLQAMDRHGAIGDDVIAALASDAAELDEEGALLAAQLLPRASLLPLLAKVVALGLASPQAQSFAAGFALRAPRPYSAREGLDDEAEAEIAAVAGTAVHAIGHAPADDRLVGKARLASWAAMGVARCEVIPRDRVLYHLSRLPLASDRMILSRSVSLRPAMLSELCEEVSFVDTVPPSLLEIAWLNPSVPDAVLFELAARIPRQRHRADDLADDEVDLDPARRSLPTLEKVVLVVTTRANVSPRAALTAAALDARRVRYMLASMPQWKGRFSGGRLARVFRQSAGTLPTAQGDPRLRGARTEPWTERPLTELELSMALAVGHLTGAEVARRIQLGRQTVDDGLTLAVGAEARAALEGPTAIQPLVAWAAKHRGAQGAALALWLLLERFERERSPLLVASALDTFASTARGALPACVSEALALIEQREPGRLDRISVAAPQSRAALASAIARAYRAVGGAHDERAHA